MAMTAHDIEEMDNRAIYFMIEHYEEKGDKVNAQLYRNLLDMEDED